MVAYQYDDPEVGEVTKYCTRLTYKSEQPFHILVIRVKFICGYIRASSHRCSSSLKTITRNTIRPALSKATYDHDTSSHIPLCYYCYRAWRYLELHYRGHGIWRVSILLGFDMNLNSLKLLELSNTRISITGTGTCLSSIQ
jgi:hypothetical protein